MIYNLPRKLKLVLVVFFILDKANTGHKQSLEYFKINVKEEIEFTVMTDGVSFPWGKYPLYLKQ